MYVAANECRKGKNKELKMIDVKEIPAWWAICQNRECKRADECLRYKAFRSMPKEVESWKCILPKVEEDGTCRQYRKAEQTMLARGFKKMYASITSRDARHDIRMALTDYFGSKGSYYRYRDGERILNAEQQQWIIKLLSRYGMDGEGCFDEYLAGYDFSKV